MIKKIISFVSSVSILCFSSTTQSPTKCEATGVAQPFEVLSMRSPFEKHYNNGDGTQTAFIDTAPIHYVNENEELVEIDNTIIQTDDGNYTNAKNSMNITLAPSADLRCLSDINSDATEDCHFISLDYMGYNVSWDIINPYDDCEEGRVCEAVPYCPIEVSEFNSQRYIETGNKQLEDYINTTILPKNSSVWYKSLFDGCDINVEIKPNSIKENIVLNSREAANQKFTYYIETNNLVADLYDDNSIAFLDKEDKVIFYIPAPFMFEAEHNNIQSYDIDVTIEKYRNGYLMSYTPSEEWVMSEERNFPIIIDPDINISDNIYTSTLSESAPTSYITGNKLKIGGVPNDHFKALISIPCLRQHFLMI